MTVPPIVPGQVTAADLYGEVTAARRDMATMLTKVEVMDDRYARHGMELTDHENRLRALEASAVPKGGERLASVEKWQWRTGGMLAVLAILAGIVAGFLEQLVNHHP